MPRIYLIIFIIFIAIIIGIVVFLTSKKKINAVPSDEVVKQILSQYVLFYKNLKEADKSKFTESVKRFLTTTKITGIKVTLEDLDKVFIAAGAIIPIFRFPKWRYNNINEVLVYPDSFSHEYKQTGAERNILGMVGTGAMHRMMILSQQSVRDGFMNDDDTRNTTIHEFVHLVDKEDGSTDGIPESLLSRKNIRSWKNIIQENQEEIAEGDSDIDPYALTNDAEFLAVVSEYYFEQPEKMRENHPDLFELLEDMFKQD